MRPKVRRNSGRVEGKCLIKDKKFVIENCLEPQKFWDDWIDYRDGYRAPTEKERLKRLKNKNV